MPNAVRRAAAAAAAPVQHVCVDHRCFHIAVDQQFLHRANVVAIGQQVRGERMAKGMARDPFGQPGLVSLRRAPGCRDGCCLSAGSAVADGHREILLLSRVALPKPNRPRICHAIINRMCPSREDLLS